MIAVQLSVTILLHCFFLGTSIASLPVLEGIAVSCGFSGNATAVDGRVWVGDTGSESSKWLQLSGKSTKSSAICSAAASTDVPYETARISSSDFTYTVPVKPGQKFIRLHFNPTSYKGFKNSRAFFTVRAGPYTLLSNFSASGTGPFSKEFCINVEENPASISITFSPVEGKRGSADNYAFVNGIEVVSMPAGLYFTPDGGLGAVVVGQKYRFYIDNSTALEMVRRLNIGGNSIPSVEDGNMFREWSKEPSHMPETGGNLIKKIIPVNYTFTPSYVAPKKVYQTARSIALENDLDKHNLTWNIPLDVGFRYLVRLHFCELELRIRECGEREFSILMNNQVAEENVDMIRWGGTHGVAFYRDYIVLMEGDRMQGMRYLNITFQPKFILSEKETGGILNGLEIFKLSNPDNSLASMTPTEYVRHSSYRAREQRKMLSSESKNYLATAVTIAITLLNIAMYYIRCLSEIDSASRNSRSSSYDSHCRQFSIAEIRSATNNFSREQLIGSGGQGRVYKGSIDRGAPVVAIKRLKSESRQGDKEFWTEIKMLSKLRHVHLVPLIGYCNDGQERVLVYEYMTKGTLADHLYKIGRHGGINPPLSWEQRLKISIGAAHGLYFLHTSRRRVIHRDVKSSNILLDENWVAKVSDFGLSKMGAPNESVSHISTNVKGTFGYIDPEYFLTKKLTRKSDVYAFGVLLFEVLSGRPAVDIRLEEEQHSLATWARYCIRKGKVEKLVESSLIEEISPACLKVFAGIAGRCLDTHPHERPAMADIVVSLELALALQQNPSSDEQIEEDNINVEKSYSDQSDGVFSFNDLSINPSNGRTEQNANVEVSGTSERTGELESGQRLRKSSNGNNASSRWWWDWILPRSPSKPKAPTLVLQEGLHKFSVQEIRKATNDFRNSFIIGSGYSDSIYKGYIDGTPPVIAVKRSSSRQSRHSMIYELQTKMEMGHSTRHAHVVSLLGYCRDENEMILIYDSMSNGSLHDHLSDPNKDPLPWKRRLQICIDIAKGMSHLHSTIKHSNLHCKLRSTNIVLDENWVARISDFCISGRQQVNDAPGSVGFMDSDYIRDDQTTEKSYVFSLGLMLFEVLCATKNSTRWLDEGQVSLAQWIRSELRNNLSGCIDPYLTGKKISSESIKIFIDTAGKCLLECATERPSMSDIVSSLEAALKQQEGAEDTKGYILSQIS
ncbi:OLC1v1009780C1 [Oldenlandia corymbosa var. corymbosa]|uniref:OLC1v1009780C1 n=1 Tax=Oldenlandia corymbosa var. corymbosa TaxID=529605 RepID=A0AAV1DPQ1_OLDCO|nr:OLC1v1009780C1 [Oldenlandia corymbosa var. corymbosa]